MNMSTRGKAWLAVVLVVAIGATGVFIWSMCDPYDTLGLHYRLTGWRGGGRARANREIRRTVARLEEQIEQGDRTVGTLVRLAAAYELASRYEEALQAADRVLAVDPAHERTRSIQMYSLLGLERYGEVQRLADLYSSLYPSDSGPAWVLVDMYRRLGDEAMAQLAQEYASAVKSGRDMPRWSVFCAEHGHPIWPETDEGVPHQSDP
jgi:tetratricopeptide (TPR) repeat protein